MDGYAFLLVRFLWTSHTNTKGYAHMTHEERSRRSAPSVLETIFIRSTRTMYLSLEENLAKIDSHLADNLSRLSHARTHGGNVKKWEHKIALLVQARNEVMLQIDARSAS